MGLTCIKNQPQYQESSIYSWISSNRSENIENQWKIGNVSRIEEIINQIVCRNNWVDPSINMISSRINENIKPEPNSTFIVIMNYDSLQKSKHLEFFNNVNTCSHPILKSVYDKLFDILKPRNDNILIHGFGSEQERIYLSIENRTLQDIQFQNYISVNYHGRAPKIDYNDAGPLSPHSEYIFKLRKNISYLFYNPSVLKVNLFIINSYSEFYEENSETWNAYCIIINHFDNVFGLLLIVRYNGITIYGSQVKTVNELHQHLLYLNKTPLKNMIITVGKFILNENEDHVVGILISRFLKFLLINKWNKTHILNLRIGRIDLAKKDSVDEFVKESNCQNIDFLMGVSIMYLLSGGE